jgi:CubicO group peptidase (beta-lactamase class C family)/D-alanyl-D-alanine dipeptidase
MMRILIFCCLFFNLSSVVYSQNSIAVVDQFVDYHRQVEENAHHQLVRLTTIIPTLQLDIRYATNNNFTGVQIYPEPAAYARLSVAKALKKVQDSLITYGYGLKVFDAYRPYDATVQMYEVYPDSTFVASPKRGSRHNRGCAVDLTLVDLRTGEELAMPTPYDDFTEKAHFEYEGVSTEVQKNRQLLHDLMTHFGFDQYPAEWWHYDYREWRDYDLMNLSFSDLALYELLPPGAIDQLVNRAMDSMQVVGAAIALVKNGQVYYEKGFGKTSAEEGKAVDPMTNFAIASNTKAFTAAALSLLVERGQIQWTDPVVEHLPEFKMYNDYVTNHFIIEDLLTHRSGLGLGAGDLMFFPDGTHFTITDILTNFQHFEPASAFRTQFDYDNVLYIVAGELIKRITGQTWEEFVQKELLEPLGMEGTYASIHQITDRASIATPHEVKGEQIKAASHFEKRINGAAGGIYSNVHDLTKWMICQLNEGVTQENKVLFSKASHRNMWSIKTPMALNAEGPRSTRFRGYGLGWFLSDAGGAYRVEHTGGLPGMLSKTLLLPEEDFGLVILTNTSPDGGAFFEAVSETIVDRVEGQSGVDWVKSYSGYLKQGNAQGDEALEEVWKQVGKVNQEAGPWKQIAGVYEDPWFGEVIIELRKDQWWLTCTRSPRLKGPIYWLEKGKFAVQWEYQEMNCDVFVYFTFGKNGISEGMTMEGISPNMDFSFDFQDLNFFKK